MTIEAKIIADSVSVEGPRLTTFQLRYPRFIHSELMTHRVFSRNASSSRAIPVHKMIQQVIDDPAEPVEWGSNQKGMQAGKELTGVALWKTRFAWHAARRAAVVCARVAMKAGAHKQIVNRILEPWAHISVIITATEWDNFFALRAHPDADPTIQALAFEMLDLYESQSQEQLAPGEWHLPYVSHTEMEIYGVDTAIKMSVARCARVSYLTHDGTKPTLGADLALYNRLVGSDPKHASPTEHQATPDRVWSRGRWAKPSQHRNFVGWRQYRGILDV